MLHEGRSDTQGEPSAKASTAFALRHKPVYVGGLASISGSFPSRGGGASALQGKADQRQKPGVGRWNGVLSHICGGGGGVGQPSDLVAH